MERLPSNAKKISRAEVEELSETDLELEKLVTVDEEDVWGHDVIEAAERSVRMKEFFKAIPEVHERARQIYQGPLRLAQEHILELAHKGSGHRLEQLTGEIVKNPDLLRRVSEEAPEIKNAEKSYRDASFGRLLALLVSDAEMFGETGKYRRRAAVRFWRTAKLSDGVWFDIAKEHIEQFRKDAEAFKERVGRAAIKEAYKDLSRGIRTNALPISHERLLHILKQTKVTIADTMHPAMEQVGGFYDWQQRKVAIASNLSRVGLETFSRFKKVLVHEYLHALAGVTAVEYWSRQRYTKEDHDDEVREGDTPPFEVGEVDEYGPNSEIQRAGLRFKTGDIVFPQSARFYWIDEAVTELIVDKLLPDNEHKSYPEYRAALSYVMQQGKNKIPFEIFKQAYFEEYEPNDEQKIPHWKALRAAINEAHGPKFLVAFDEMITKNSVEDAIARARSGTISATTEVRPRPKA